MDATTRRCAFVVDGGERMSGRRYNRNGVHYGFIASTKASAPERVLLFCRTGSGVSWFSGLGRGAIAWRFSDHISEAVSFTEGPDLSMTKKAIERHTERTWETIPTTDAFHQADIRCSQCNTGWSHQEKALIKGSATNFEIENALDSGEVRLGSPLFAPEAETFRANVLTSGVCPSCASVLCGSCMPPKRGRNAGRCANCR